MALNRKVPEFNLVIGLIFEMILLIGATKISNRVAPDVVDIDEDLHALDIEDVYHLSDQIAVLGLVRILHNS